MEEHVIYAGHRGVWWGLGQLRGRAWVATVDGRRPIAGADDLAEGDILHMRDGRCYEVFLADRGRGRFFCERVDAAVAA